MLSICIFEILNTADTRLSSKTTELWIALDLYLWNIEHSTPTFRQRIETVVNCSRFVSLKYWTQQIKKCDVYVGGCELLSICIFEILNTAWVEWLPNEVELWIALDLYLWNIEHSYRCFKMMRWQVVNCSRFVSLKYWTQHSKLVEQWAGCCELLSICIFEILNTAR